MMKQTMKRTIRHVDVSAGSAPIVHPDVEGFWGHVAGGNIALQRCGDCSTLRFPVAPGCHECLSGAFSWEEIDPRGQIDVAIEVHRAVSSLRPSGVSLTEPWRSMTPYISGVVTMTEGVRLPGRIVCDCGAALRPGTEVEAVTMDTVNETVNYGFLHDCGQGAGDDSE